MRKENSVRKGSRARYCHVCREIVGWSIPTGESFLGIQCANMKWLPNYGKHDGKGYVCKKCMGENK